MEDTQKLMALMDDTRKVQFVLAKEALAVVDAKAEGERKKGEWISKAIIDYSRIMAGVGELGNGDTGLLERIDSRLGRIEKQLAVLIAERQ
jgi:hypothetical protein